MELTSSVVSVEDKMSAKGKPYWTITWGNNTKDNIVNPVFHKLICEAKNAGKEVKVAKEKQGQYYSVVAVEVVDSQSPVAQDNTAQPVTNSSHAQNNDKVRSMALSYAKDIVCAALLNAEDVLVWAEIFYRYLNGDLVVEDMKVLKLIMKLAREE